MCLITTQRKPKIAKKDIVVYKEVIEDSEIGYRSCYYGYFHYLPGQLYTTEIKETDVWGCHSEEEFEWLDSQHPNWRNGTDKRLKSFGPGFHSKSMKDLVYAESSIVEAIIPKGSLYYKNKSGMVISNQIIIP